MRENVIWPRQQLEAGAKKLGYKPLQVKKGATIILPKALPNADRFQNSLS